MRELVLAIDQGTSSTKCLLVDATGAVVASGAAPLGESCPRPGWVEQDPQAIWESVENAVRAALSDTDPARIAGVGFSTQRESVLLWDRGTGEALSPLLSWQDQRTAPLARAIGTTEVRRTVRRISGLPLDPMFSALKARWLLDTYDPDRKRAEAGEIVLGTVDSWLLSRFGTEPLIEIGNASRTQLLDTGVAAWSEELCALFGVPMAALPRIVSSTGPFPTVRGLQPLPDGIPVAAVMGDSHAALFGHGVRAPGAVKATYGTGSSVMGLVGAASEQMDPGTCLTIGWQIAGQAPAFAAEGNIRSSGATLKWLSSIFGASVDSLVDEALAGGTAEGEDAGIHLVPAFNGLGAPHWDDAAVAILSGFRLGTPRGALVLAGLRSIAHQITDVVESIERTTKRPIDMLFADGGAAANDALMQMQADLAGLTVQRSPVVGLSAIGAAHMAGLSTGLLTEQTLAAPGRERSIFRPVLDVEPRARSRNGWHAAVARSRLEANAPQAPARMQTKAGG
ncbi:glycerol kinase [Aurantimonas aggregata]|uniref:Glycerol kinase n=1 Tax=Aurantimonas aggregata TaxID=2047720 RepID=A0A6L9MFG6_9HYPH|nr:FGGY family carbohydrate kinase [Aurantimonas aggregata]NDV86594.1 glycerol kinase [Aurantimonas aggregata]